MIQFRKFSKFDWMTYGGAEPFTSEQEPGEDRDPYIADLQVDCEDTEVILDSTGLAVVMMNEEPDAQGADTYELRVNFDKAALALVKMTSKMTTAELKALGFEPLGK